MIEAALPVTLVLALVVYVSIRLEERVRVVRALGSVLVAIVIAAVLANAGILSSRSPAYGLLGGLGVNIGVVLILLGVDLRTVREAGAPMLAAFFLGAAGTAIGSVLATLLLSDAVGPEAWKLAGQYTGTYVGGGLNMVSIGRGLETSPALFTAAIAADNVTTTLWMIACFAAPAVLKRYWPRPDPPSDSGGVEIDSHDFVDSGRPVHLRDAAFLALLTLGVIWASETISNAVSWPVPTILWLTTIALVTAQVPFVRSVAGGPMLGNYTLYLFLASIGAQSVVREILNVGPAVFYFTLIIIAVHGLLIFGVGRLLRLDLGTIAIASQANVGGPASAMALASARGYVDRLLPGVAVGLLGYAVGNYAGFAVAALMHHVL